MRACILSILLLAALARFSLLGSNPAGIFHDEAEKGYSAYSLLQIGGTLEFTRTVPNPQGLPVPVFHPWPLFVDVWGSLTSMVYQYAALPFVAVGGLNAWTTRLPAALVGTLTVLCSFFLARKLFTFEQGPAIAHIFPALRPGEKNKENKKDILSSPLGGSLSLPTFSSITPERGTKEEKRRISPLSPCGREVGGEGAAFPYATRVALWTMALLAVSPWHLIFSRWAQQGIFVPFFLSAGLLVFLKAMEALSANAALPASSLRSPVSSLFLLLLASAAFALAFYAYSGAQPFLLLFFPLIALVWRRQLLCHWKMTLPALALLIALMLPTLHATFGGGGAGMGRFERLSVFRPEGQPVPFLYAAFLFVKNYLSHFSPQFLFFTGDSLDRHGLRGFGEMLHIELPFLVAGITIAAKRRSRADLFLLGWFLLFPVSAALTNEGIPHALRTLHAVPCPQILSAIGVVHILDYLKRRWGRWAQTAAITLVAANGAAVLFALFLWYPHYSAPSFEFGVREALEIASENAHRSGFAAGTLYLPADCGIPLVPELFLFHTRTSPSLLRAEGLTAAPFRFLSSTPSLAGFSSLLQPGDSILLSPAVFQSTRNSGDTLPVSLRMASVLWRPYPFSSQTFPLYLLVTR